MTEEAEVKKELSKKPTTDSNTVISNKRRYWLAGGVAAMVLTLLIGVLIGNVITIRRPGGLTLARFSGNEITAPIKGFSGGRGMAMGVPDVEERNKANYQRIRGVVTAVSGDTFTVAGNGATNSVKTDSSTEYIGGDSVKVNDTVLVLGTTSESTFTASKVYINNN